MTTATKTSKDTEIEVLRDALYLVCEDMERRGCVTCPVSSDLCTDDLDCASLLARHYEARAESLESGSVPTW